MFRYFHNNIYYFSNYMKRVNYTRKLQIYFELHWATVLVPLVVQNECESPLTVTPSVTKLLNTSSNDKKSNKPGKRLC